MKATSLENLVNAQISCKWSFISIFGGSKLSLLKNLRNVMYKNTKSIQSCAQFCRKQKQNEESSPLKF